MGKGGGRLTIAIKHIKLTLKGGSQVGLLGAWKHDTNGGPVVSTEREPGVDGLFFGEKTHKFHWLVLNPQPIAHLLVI